MLDRLLTAVLAPGTDDRRQRWVASIAPAVLLGAAWAASYLAGGSQTAMPHVFYVPVLVASVALGVRGGVVAGVVAAVLCGPLLPLDVAAGEAQAASNWLTRGAFFVAVGAVAGAGVRSIRRVYEDAIERSLADELRSPARPDRPSAEASAEVHRFLDAQAFHTVFQPIHRLDDGRLVAVEALTRFHSEPYVTPDVWFERATAIGLGPELELAAAGNALATAASALPDGVALSINVSPPVLLDDRLTALLDRHPHHRVLLEVTEHAIVDDYHELDLALGRLRRRGAQLAVDDAGAGFSSLRHIVRLAPEVIKLDLSLTQGLGSDPVRTALADCLVDFARRTGTLLVAEGMEQPADLDLWRQLGADAAQGYLLGRPGPLQALQVAARFA